jgi:hypothetical protein
VLKHKSVIVGVGGVIIGIVVTLIAVNIDFVAVVMDQLYIYSVDIKSHTIVGLIGLCFIVVAIVVGMYCANSLDD